MDECRLRTGELGKTRTSYHGPKRTRLPYTRLHPAMLILLSAFLFLASCCVFPFFLCAASAPVTLTLLLQQLHLPQGTIMELILKMLYVFMHPLQEFKWGGGGFYPVLIFAHLQTAGSRLRLSLLKVHLNNVTGL